RVEGLQRFVVEAVGRQPPHLEVLQQHIALRHQLTDETLPFGLGEVQGQGLLVAVGTLEVSGLPRISALRILYIRRAPMPGVVAAARTLDLDHLGPKVAQYLPGPGP